ncbi:hypothetical protein [Spirilliplanes yamanashiensis]|uniref:Uncharacterized protein n=1 Tax=Spirilliplanes yamanashiensis TaxID=42233 RepID=A0A8J3YF02_9ACTN|nr:hypothetical protein [Spirilliplanes yamanashiensis]MDP9815227.1 hypothetical protein [Spirilliplanes yamanashiensis]GIJ06505.1 hypothetical protein Sya03_58570 [Spirilliplanes yamanashiensis]
MAPPDMADLRALVGRGIEDVLTDPAADRLERVAAAGPEGFAEAAAPVLEAAAGTHDLTGVLVWLTTCAAWPRVAPVLGRRRALARHVAEAATTAAEAWRYVPAGVVTAADADGEAWAGDLLVELFDPGSPLPAAERWRAVAGVLGHPTDRVRERAQLMLATAAWSRADPPPGDDEARRAAAEHADHLERLLAEPGGWLAELARALPGCGEPTCCREGHLVAELTRRGHRPRRWAGGPRPARG